MKREKQAAIYLQLERIEIGQDFTLYYTTLEERADIYKIVVQAAKKYNKKLKTISYNAFQSNTNEPVYIQQYIVEGSKIQ